MHTTDDQDQFVLTKRIDPITSLLCVLIISSLFLVLFFFINIILSKTLFI